MKKTQEINKITGLYKIVGGLVATVVLIMGTFSVTYAREATGKCTQVSIPEADDDINSIGADMPYIRFDSCEAKLGGGAELKSSYTWDLEEIASQASNQTYINLPSEGAYAEWTIDTCGNGVTMRFTMPDTVDGMGQDGSVDVYVNGSKVKNIDLTSYYMWQYMDGSPKDAPGEGTACFAFDEVHFLLQERLESGDRIRIQSSGAYGLTYGVDFIEIEEVEEPIKQPKNSYSVADYGAIADDGEDDYVAIKACVAAADKDGKNVYIPAGTYHINQIWSLEAKDMTITGAGIWYTNIQFTNDKAQSGGIAGVGNGKINNIEFCNMYINSNLRSRYEEQAIYKCFMGTYGDDTYIHDIWEEHFECGFWIADYEQPVDYTENLRIANCRIRNNFADGVNFCQGTSNSVVYNCSIRNNGDDGLAVWNNDYLKVKDSKNNRFCYNTIDLTWRAGAIAIYGGDGHEIYNNYIRDSFMASGIHLNTTFSGYKFTNTQNIHFANNIIISSGTSNESWGNELGAVDVIGNVKNITFDNTYIYNAQHDGVRVGDNVTKIVFNDLYIYGAGVDGKRPDKISVAHRGAAVMNFGGNAMVTVNKMYLRNIANTNVNFLIKEEGIQLNDQIEEGNIGYQIPPYPNAEALEEENVEPLVVDGVDVSPDNCEIPDIVVIDVKWEPEIVAEGDSIVFSAVITNQGNCATPVGTINGAQFQVDGVCVVWSDTDKTSIKPGESVTITANSGPVGTDVWSAELGEHEITVWVNDTARYGESDMENNKLSKKMNVLTVEEKTQLESGDSQMTENTTENVNSEKSEESDNNIDSKRYDFLGVLVVIIIIIIIIVGVAIIYRQKHSS
ncbi:CARDB domain-containing protein [Anaerosporobacter sp.]|uniref:CARDB domain-containing protein n=1 Tax=Anaerosporobacter sp. TaxID=1872529 RepID=UPI00286EC875|nr:CARDB domain-containing protein [Anaerosporobacter sp.]